MELFGVGLPEVMVIIIVALIVLGPDRLPEAARTIGKGIAEFRRATEPARTMWRDLSSEITSVATTTQAAMQPVLKPGSLLERNGNNGAGTQKAPASSAVVDNTGSSNGSAPAAPKITEMMSQEERDSFFAGGELPPHVASGLAAQVGDGAGINSAGANGHSTYNLVDAVELPHLDYPMPHSALSYEPAPPYNEDLWYPAPSDKDEPAADEDQSRGPLGESY